MSATDSVGIAPPAPSGAGKLANEVKREELRACIKQKRLVVVTGTGVSLQSVGYPAAGTAIASWNGLLDSGVDYCKRYNLLEPTDEQIINLQIKSGTDDMIDAAQRIHDRLAKRINGRQFWLKETVGELKVTDPRLIKAIQGLGGLLATLNYDSLLTQVTGRPMLHWLQQVEIDAYMRGPSRDFILHIHGRWEAPDSIVLDRKSYEAIAQHKEMQELMQSFARWETMLFIGCWRTLLDPNFQTLLKWAETALKGARHRHFILCRESEENALTSALSKHGYLEPLCYGNDHADLIPFLEKLALDAGVAAVNANPPVVPPVAAPAGRSVLTPAEIWKQQSQG